MFRRRLGGWPPEWLKPSGYPLAYALNGRTRAQAQMEAFDITELPRLEDQATPDAAVSNRPHTLNPGLSSLG